MKDCISEFIQDGFEEVVLDFDRQMEKYVKYESFAIDTGLFMQELKTECVLRGVSFVQKEFNNLDDIISVPEESVMNCLGLASQKIFKDEAVYRILGMTCTLENLNTSSSDYILRQINN